MTDFYQIEPSFAKTIIVAESIRSYVPLGDAAGNKLLTFGRLPGGNVP